MRSTLSLAHEAIRWRRASTNSSATNLSLSDASGSSRMLRSCCRCDGRSKCAMSTIAADDSSRNASGSTWRICLPATSTVET